MNDVVHIIGGGLAGCEAAWQLALRDIPVIIHEMRPERQTDAHKTSDLGELVCSNSFRSDDHTSNAVGLLHHEMRQAKSLIMAVADQHQLPAGGALAVDRDGFSSEITRSMSEHPLISVERGEITGLPPLDWQQVIIATGPLTSADLAAAVRERTGDDGLAFFDAIAPIIYRDSIDFDIAWYQSRYDKSGPGGTGADYINCPLDKAQYEHFLDLLIAGDKTEFRDFEQNTPYFDGCLPIEVMAERGPETLRFGPMKPRGLTNAHQPDIKPHAVVQLRQDNKLGTLYNMVGFQTKLKYGAQADVIRTIPGLQNAEFARLGGLHRNSFLNSPQVLDNQMRLKAEPRLRFAGQITGVEGYVESAAMGMLAGLLSAAEMREQEIAPPPQTTALGALLHHITGGHIAGGKQSFQPMNINFGLFPEVSAPVDETDKKIRGKARKPARQKAYTDRAKADFANWLAAL